MSRKQLKITGTIFAILSVVIMFLPWIYAYNSGNVECHDFTTIGFGLTEFSAWGLILLIIPVLMLGTMYSNLNDKIKNVMFLGIYLLSQLSFYFAVTMGMEWLREVSTEYVRPLIWLLLHPVLIFMSILSFYLHCNKSCNANCNTDTYSEELFLSSRPYSFGIQKKDCGLTTFDGCVSFITKDGYFAALGHNDSESSIEIFDKGNAAGFIMRTRQSGIYGSFYEDYATSYDTKMNVMPFESIKCGLAQLWLPGENGFVKKNVEINPHNSLHITCKLSNNNKIDTVIDGAVIIQNGKIAAVVSGYDCEKGVYNCISAARVAMSLFHLAQEQKNLEIM